MEVGIFYFKHTYSMGLVTGERKHVCMQYGYWCGRQALEDPLLAIRFIFHKVDHLRRQIGRAAVCRCKRLIRESNNK